MNLAMLLAHMKGWNHRNHKKDDEHLNRNTLAHFDPSVLDVKWILLEGGESATYREKDIPLLMSIRNGNIRKRMEHMSRSSLIWCFYLKNGCSMRYGTHGSPAGQIYINVQ